jgi:hypothetical protein
MRWEPSTGTLQLLVRYAAFTVIFARSTHKAILDGGTVKVPYEEPHLLHAHTPRAITWKIPGMMNYGTAQGVDILGKQRGPIGNFRLSHAVFMTTTLLAAHPPKPKAEEGECARSKNGM